MKYIQHNIRLVFFLNWLLVIFSFILLNYNLYSLLCSYSFFNFINLHNFFYYLVYSNFLLDTCFLYKFSDYVNLYNNGLSNFLMNLIGSNSLDYFIFDSIYNYLDNIKKFDNLNIYCVYFDTKVIDSHNLLFYPLQKKVFILPGETTLCFYRIINNTDTNIHGIPIYIISPFEFSSFITKVQCFCFEEIFIFPYEIIELPILFFINSKALSLSYSFKNEFSIEYIFFCNSTL